MHADSLLYCVAIAGAVAGAVAGAAAAGAAAATTVIQRCSLTNVRHTLGNWQLIGAILVQENALRQRLTATPPAFHHFVRFHTHVPFTLSYPLLLTLWLLLAPLTLSSLHTL